MGGDCRDSQFWDALLRKCVDCHAVCGQQYVIARCASYCVSARCKARPGHYYDQLMKKCMNCTKICGRHTAECSQHCQSLSPPVTTQKLLLEVDSQVSNSREPTALGDSAVLLYSLLAVCMALLLSSLSLALVVLLRGSKAKTANPRPTGDNNHEMKTVAQPRQELGFQGQLGKNTKGFPAGSTCPTNPEPSDDSNPTETCVCVHCFPDLKTLGQGSDRPPKAPFSFYQPAVLHGAQIQNGGPLCTEESQHNTSGPQV